MISRTFATPLFLLAMLVQPLDAQPRNREVGSVPREVAREATRIFNAGATRRVRGDFTLAAPDTVRGDVAVLNGHARVAGVITGQLVVLNGDATLVAGGRIDGSLTVLGGSFDSPDRPAIGGDIRIWSARLRYREDADTLIADVDREFFTRWARWQRDDPNGSESQLFLTTAHTYNRVEGLPIYLGPRIRVRNGDTRMEAEVFGIFRTSDQLDFTRENLGHRVRLELRQGRAAGFLLGGRLFDEVDAVERWQLRESEVGLASFLATRDYRDYWSRHGASGYLGVFGPGKSELRAAFGEERWSSRRMHDVPSLFNSDVPWRVNPRSDEGVMHVATLSAKLDTRNRVDDPRSGWYLQADVERGTGTLGSLAATTMDTRPMQVAGAVTYSRALLDLRRYNRLAPGAQLNMRVVGGGWLSGDPLPLQRRFAVSGMDALPGRDFRQMSGDVDVTTCASGDANVYAALGRPAQCERILLVQAEFKGDFRINLGGDDDGFGDRRWMAGRFRADGAWVLFANSGRGWLVNGSGSALHVTSGIPPVSTWQNDVGGGFDFGSFGVYVAKSVTESDLPANVYVRLGRRF